MINQSELFPELASESPKAKKGDITLSEFVKQYHKQGVIVPPGLAARLMRLTRTRIYQLTQDGRLETVNECGYNLITLTSIVRYWGGVGKKKPGRKPK